MALVAFYRYFSVPPAVHLSNKQRELLGMPAVSEEQEQLRTSSSTNLSSHDSHAVQ